MASGTIKAYGLLPEQLADKEIDWLSDTLKAILTTSTHTPNQDTHDYVDDVTANEVSGTGYTAGGMALTGKTESYVSGSNTVRWISDDLVWTTVTLTDVKNVHFYDATPASDATRPLIAYATLDVALAPNAGNLTLDLDATNGWLNFTAS